MTASTGKPRPVPQRVAWFDGATLSHGDLAAALAHEERMLALHVAALHHTHGVALGLGTALGTDGVSVLVGPGLAYTATGNALMLTMATPAPVFPTSVAVADLVISAPLAGYERACERVLDCDGRSRRPVPLLRWIPAEGKGATCSPECDAGRLVEVVVLGRYVRRPDGSLGGPDTRGRPVARGLLRPHLAQFALGPGALTWSEGAFDFVATVDTSVAGFSTVPRYSVSLSTVGVWPGGVVGPFVAVDSPTATSFVLRLLFAAPPGTPPGTGLPAPAILAQLATLSVVWLGAENARGCPPLFAAWTFFDLNPSLWSGALAALQGGAQ